jgi:hypothetical protein
VNQTLLEDLGFNVRQSDDSFEADLELSSGQLINPLTRQFLTKATFTVLGDRLLVIDPPELVGCPPILLARVEKASDIEQALSDSLNEHIFQISRRSGELTALGISPKVAPETLQLSAEVRAGRFTFVIASDRLGNFRVARALRDGEELTTSSVQAFELSEFRDRTALEGYLAALFGDLLESMPEAEIDEQPSQPVGQIDERTQPDARVHPSAPPPTHAPLAPAAGPDVVSFGDIIDKFGAASIVPPRSPIEILLELRVRGKLYRFAAARVAGRTFRGLLATREGKVWAERFELDDFPGVAELVSKVLGVAREQVELPGEK